MNYWQVKAAELERQLRTEQLKQQAREVDAAFVKVMVANGLDPAKHYRMRDDTEEITEATDAAPA